jgi:hypothetical protein
MDDKIINNLEVILKEIDNIKAKIYFQRKRINQSLEQNKHLEERVLKIEKVLQETKTLQEGKRA